MRQVLKMLILLLPLFAGAQQTPVDSMYDHLAHARTDSARYQAYVGLYFYHSESNTDSAIYFADKMVQLARKNNKQPDEIISLSFIGYQLYQESKWADSYKILLEAFQLADKAGDDPNPWFYGISTGENTAKKNAQAGLHFIYGHLSGVISDSGQLAQYREAFRLSKETGNKIIQYLAEMNMGVALLPHKLDSALLLEQDAGRLSQESGNLQYQGFISANIANIYLMKGDTTTAKEQFYHALAVSQEMDDVSQVAFCLFKLTEIFLHKGNSDSAYHYAMQLKQQMESTPGFTNNDVVNSGTVYQNLSLAYKLKNENDSAYKYQRMAYHNIDSLYTARQGLVKEFQRLSLNEQIHSHQLEKEKIQTAANTRTYAMLAGLIVVLFIAFILYRSNTQKQKANKVLQTTLSDLKSAQAQLIQSEKMASLGELTAGIAHEIQNPLNFVNNFSEVSNEMLDEMKTDLASGNLEEAIKTADVIKQNLEKIDYHGKRADAIVKSMLQHSRAGTGQKEPTDINALCDEYLRLSYHGLRAKDKSFNAIMKTDFDNSIEKINIVRQDVGRVLLNLITNAFYAVNEKQKASPQPVNGSEAYIPTVTVVTKKYNSPSGDGGVEIIVTDNGNGIPQNIIDKIFQPFFTTKPTGSGTGLGLSLAYDIIKAHGGTIKVQTPSSSQTGKQDEGSTFIVQLPAQ
jgi:signal transduction histidine kinase